MSHSKIKVLVHSNYSRLLTGFGKNAKNILLSLYDDPEIEVFEAANGSVISNDLGTPWESYGTYPSNERTLAHIQQNPSLKRAAQYGFYTIDEIVEKVKPDVYLGIEDIWAFRQFEKKDWWDKTKTILWTTLDSLPILDSAKEMYGCCDKMLVWASFAEREMKKLGFSDVETLHGAVDYSHFYPIEEREDLRKKHDLNENFVIGFVFKNQLRKSVPNLLEGFKRFKENNKDCKPKLLLHSDWSDKNSGWDIEKYIEEKKINKEDVLATYVCNKCNHYFVKPYKGEGFDCQHCNSKGCVKTKNSSKGVSEKQLNEIYNLMDVYCHPFTSGGQELPIQEAKSAGLITLVTDYSCGEDSCHPHQGGLPLSWNEYREPSTRFIKASTDPDSISSQLSKVLKMGEEEKSELLKNGRENILENFSVEKISLKLKKIIKEVHKKDKKHTKTDEDEAEKDRVTIEQLLDDEGVENRILVAIEDNASGILMINGLLENIKKTYPEKNIYVATNLDFQPLIDDNPNLHKVIPYSKMFSNPLNAEGSFHHPSYFEIAFLPEITTKNNPCYMHNAADKIQFFNQ
jgi:glycosyltransferase involved in cell wall biosynthesis